MFDESTRVERAAQLAGVAVLPGREISWRPGASWVAAGTPAAIDPSRPERHPAPFRPHRRVSLRASRAAMAISSTTAWVSNMRR